MMFATVIMAFMFGERISPFRRLRGCFTIECFVSVTVRSGSKMSRGCVC